MIELYCAFCDTEIMAPQHKNYISFLKLMVHVVVIPYGFCEGFNFWCMHVRQYTARSSDSRVDERGRSHPRSQE